jgi:hypothetical protein
LIPLNWYYIQAFFWTADRVALTRGLESEAGGMILLNLRDDSASPIHSVRR